MHSLFSHFFFPTLRPSFFHIQSLLTGNFMIITFTGGLVKWGVRGNLRKEYFYLPAPPTSVMCTSRYAWHWSGSIKLCQLWALTRYGYSHLDRPTICTWSPPVWAMCLTWTQAWMRIHSLQERKHSPKLGARVLGLCRKEYQEEKSYFNISIFYWNKFRKIWGGKKRGIRVQERTSLLQIEIKQATR